MGDELYIFNNSPASLEDWGATNQPLYEAPYWGWSTEQRYKVLDKCGNPMNWIVLNEKFTNRRYGPSFPSSNWPLSWTNGVWDADDYDQYGEFSDYIYEIDQAGKSPTPLVPGGNSLSEATSAQVSLHDQTYRAGSSSTGIGTLVGSGTQIHFLDHGKIQQA